MGGGGVKVLTVAAERMGEEGSGQRGEKRIQGRTKAGGKDGRKRAEVVMMMRGGGWGQLREDKGMVLFPFFLRPPPS